MYLKVKDRKIISSYYYGNVSTIFEYNSFQFMKHCLTLVLFLVCFTSFAQPTVEWSPYYQLTLEDFQSPQSEINSSLNSYSISSGTMLNFGYQMNNYDFMFRKNFNSQVVATFNKNAAVIIAPDSTMAMNFVSYAQYCFDLTELYARRFRKEVYEQKGTFSGQDFYMPIFEKIQQDMNGEMARVSKATDLGRNRELLDEEHRKVLAAIDSLSDFCKNCKPPKKKKKKH